MIKALLGSLLALAFVTPVWADQFSDDEAAAEALGSKIQADTIALELDRANKASKADIKAGAMTLHTDKVELKVLLVDIKKLIKENPASP